MAVKLPREPEKERITQDPYRGREDEDFDEGFFRRRDNEPLKPAPPEFEEKLKRVDESKETVTVGIQTDTPHRIDKESFDKINEQSPILANILKREGIDAYYRAYKDVVLEVGKREASKIKQDIEQRSQNKIREREEIKAGNFRPVASKRNAVSMTTDLGNINYEKTIAERVTITKVLWRALTPWMEENGETVISFIQNTPQRFKKDILLPQANLKAQWESEKVRPAWLTFLIGPSVIKGNDGNYYPIVAGEPPPILPAGGATKLTKLIIDSATKKLPEIERATKGGKALTKLLTAEDLGLSEAQFQRLLQSRLKQLGGKVGSSTKLTKQLEKEISDILQQSNKLNKAKEIIRRFFGKDPVKMTDKEIKALPGLAKGNSKEVKEAADLIAKTLSKPEPAKKLREATTVEARQAIPGRLTAPQMERLLQEAAQMKPANIPAELILPLTVVSPANAAKLLNKPGSGKLKQELSKEIVNSLSKGHLSSAQSQAMEQIQEQTKTETQGKTKVEPLTETTTAEALGQVTPQKQPQTSPAELPQPQPQPQPEPNPLPQPKNKQAQQTITPNPTPSNTITSLSSKLTGVTSRASDKTKREYIRQAGGAIAWRQGELQGKSIWHVIVNPYTNNEYHLMVLGAAPKGAVVVQKGKGSAYGTAQVLKGIAPKRTVTIDSGITDIQISPTGKNKVKMRVTADPKQETKGDITIGNKTPRISGRGIRISQKIPKLR